MARRVFITVGEPSGDQHAANLVRELRAMEPSLIIEGLGGPRMAEAGAKVHHDTVARAAMGLEAAFRYVELKRILNWSGRYFKEHRPDLQICIDSWAMNWHWARLARENDVPVLYYIAPQVWASRPGRVKRLKQYVDRVACILPFEEQFFRERGIEATFVGHPLFDAAQASGVEDPKEHFPNRPPVIGLAPGSRSLVARKNFRHLLDVADRILQAFPEAKFMIPTMPATHAILEKLVRDKETGAAQTTDAAGLITIGRFTLGQGKFDELIPRCDLCISVSGTATLHAAVHGVPLIVVYRVTRAVWHLLGRWVIKTRTYSLVNLLNDTRQEIVPEFIPWYGSNAPVANKALEYLQNPALLAEQSQRLRQVIRGLNKPGASRSVAELAIDLMNARGKTLPPE
jgi:lipid-A-disaccharide synthase